MANVIDNLIISLTSYPARIETVNQTIETLLNQTIKASKIVLWLGDEQFPNKEKDLPKELLDLCSKGLEIGYCKDIKAYTKLLPSLKKYPNKIIVTADDDILYKKDWLEKLYVAYQKNPKIIHCHRAHLILFDHKGQIKPYNEWWLEHGKNKPSFNNFLTGVGGVLYPANIFYKDILNEEIFSKLSPMNDDIWYWAMAVLNNVKINVVNDNYSELTYIEGSQENLSCLWRTNVSQNKNDIQLNNILNYYPKIMKMLDKKCYGEKKITFLKKLFSATTSISENKVYKVIYILGIKIKFTDKYKTLKINIEKNQNELKDFKKEILEILMHNHLIRGQNAERLLPEFYTNIYEYNLFLKHKFAYEYVAKQLSSGFKVLEIGCGDGYGADILSENKEVEVFATDIVDNVVLDAKKKYVKDNLHFELFNKKFENNSFDAIVSFQVIEHVENVQEYLTNLYNLLKDNGKLYLTTPNSTYRLVKGQKPWNIYHLREYEESSFKKDILPIFKNTQIFGIKAKTPLMELEKERVKPNRSDYNGESKDIEYAKEYTKTYSTNDYFIDDKEINDGLDIFSISTK